MPLAKSFVAQLVPDHILVVDQKNGRMRDPFPTLFEYTISLDRLASRIGEERISDSPLLGKPLEDLYRVIADRDQLDFRRPQRFQVCLQLN